MALPVSFGAELKAFSPGVILATTPAIPNIPINGQIIDKTAT